MNGRLGTLLLSLLIVFEAYSIKLCDNACSESSASVCSREDDGSKEEILLLGLFPCNAEDYEGRGITVAGQMAVRQINNRTDILENYRLTLLVEDVMVSILVPLHRMSRARREMLSQELIVMDFPKPCRAHEHDPGCLHHVFM